MVIKAGAMNMKSNNSLVEIILDVLGVENSKRPKLALGTRTFYRKNINTIFIGCDKMPRAIVEIGHECMHCCQNAEGRLGNYSVADRLAYTNKAEGMFFKYVFEREAQAFGWILAGKLVEMFYSDRADIKEAYEKNRDLYSEMFRLVESSVTTVQDMNSLQQLLDEEFTRSKEKWSSRIDVFKQQFIDWYLN